jgi:hypothetical protein
LPGQPINAPAKSAFGRFSQGVVARLEPSAAAISGSGPCAAGLAKAIRANGLDRWPRVVAAMAEEASAEPEVTLPPGHYFAPLVSLMNRILAVRPGDDVSALRRAISEAFHAKGDTIGGNQVNALLSDMTEDGANLAARRAVADELAHYARTDPEQVAQFRAGLVGGALAATTAATADQVAAAKAGAPPEEGSATQRAGTAAQRSESTTAAGVETSTASESKIVNANTEPQAQAILLSGTRFGHTFDEHEQDATKFLTNRARAMGEPNGQFLDDQAAARFIQDNLDKAKGGAVSLPIPTGFPARVINPDGSFSPARTIRLVPNRNGVKTAYPEP